MANKLTRKQWDKVFEYDTHCPNVYPDDLQLEHIDKEIYEDILTINKSDWVSTFGCCAGHLNRKNRISSYPILALLVANRNIVKLMQIIYEAVPRQVGFEIAQFKPKGWAHIFLLFHTTLPPELEEKEFDKYVVYKRREQIRKIAEAIANN